ncbi:MAG: hypothetical protein DRJ65_11855 [Acidobacteria bacterium]|nr:MAG: hypothetical protein DRJ65_11855 [Acidobacteriota bacterium]
MSDSFGGPGPRDLTGTTLAVVAGSVAALLGSLIARIVMARTLAPSELGVLLAAVAVASALGGMLSLGLNPATTRRIAGLRATGAADEAYATARTALQLAATAGGGGMVALAATGLLVAHGHALLPASWQALGWGLTGVAPVVLALPVGLAVLGVCRGFGEVAGRALVRDGGGGLLRAVAVGLAALAGGSVLVFALAFTIGSVGAEGLFALYGQRRGWFKRGGGWDRGLTASLRPFAALEVLGQFQTWLDMAVVALFASPTQVGYFGIAKGLLRAMGLLAAAGSHGYLPLAAAAHQRGDREGLGAAYRHARLMSLALVWLPAGLCLLVPQQVIVAFAGTPYAPAALTLRVLAVALLVEVLPGYMYVTLEAMNEAAALAWMRTVSLLLGALAMAVLTNWHGAAGTAAGLLVMAGCRNLLVGIHLCRRLRPGFAALRHVGAVPAATALLAAGAVAGFLWPGIPEVIIATVASGLGAAILWRAA